MRRDETVGSRTTKIRVKMEKLWIYKFLNCFYTENQFLDYLL
jgi:hypothetical protein